MPKLAFDAVNDQNAHAWCFLRLVLLPNLLKVHFDLSLSGNYLLFRDSVFIVGLVLSGRRVLWLMLCMYGVGRIVWRL